MNQELMNVFGQTSGTQTFDQIKIAIASPETPAPITDTLAISQ